LDTASYCRDLTSETEATARISYNDYFMVLCQLSPKNPNRVNSK